MRTFLVRIPEVYLRTIRVEAGDKADAMHRATVLHEGTEDAELRYKRTLDVSDWEVIPEVVEGLFERTLVALQDLLEMVVTDIHPVDPRVGNAIEVISDIGQWGELLNNDE